MNEVLVKTINLVKNFPIKGGLFSREVASVKAVQNVSLEIYKGETLGLVGESGCGKSTLGRLLLRLIEPTYGSISIRGKNLLEFSRKQLRQARRQMQMIFQDPYASLNPRMTVESILDEPLKVHNIGGNRKARRERIFELLNLVGLRPDSIYRYPHEFSGGQRQRIGIARSIAVHPEFIVADEPISALDVSIQAQIINLMQDLQEKFGLTYLFVAHDLKVIEYISDRVAVMYLGKIVELTFSKEIYKNPLHPYTQALLSAIPVPDPKARKQRIILTGDVPNPIDPPSGCCFHPRCPLDKVEACKSVEPELREVAPGHWVACHLV
ncbi:MAG: dipeptide ABC transporter ATP-binding protein [Deltaproteobacteria bacterium]|nr:dipeptide ABC transporter ATP-binding protein [Deltaproteobacteria bacterium]